MFTLFLRSVIVYAFLILTMRILGKRQMGELQPYEFALTILLAEIIGEPVSNVSTPLLHGLLPVAAVIVVQGVISIACMKSDRIRLLVSGRPTIVVRRGVIDRQALDELCLGPADLLEGLRGAGFMDVADVGAAVVEANGSISAFPLENKRPPTTEEMNIRPPREGLPLLLVLDGRIQQRSLQACRRDKAWLKNILKGLGLCESGVFLATLDPLGMLTVQTMDGKIQSIAAMKEGEVNP